MRIAIVGAGIAGLTAALALSGHADEIVILERRTGFGEAGAGIQLSPNASRVLVALGLGPALRRSGTAPTRVRIRSLRGGRDLGEVRLGPSMEERFGAPYLQIARADLHAILLDAVRARSHTRLLLGRTVTLSEGGDLDVTRVGGLGERLPADLVVGADGIGSSLRTGIGDRRQPRYAGYAAARAVVPVEAPMPDTVLWLGPGRHVVQYRLDRDRVNIVAVHRRADPVEGWSAPEAAPAFARRFGPVPQPLRALMAKVETWSVWSLYDLPVGPMVAGRTVLIGDAAHPVLPYLAQGGALAIEDAVELAGLLDPNDIPASLLAFEARRRPRAGKVQSAARRNGFSYHCGWPASEVRNTILRRVGPEGLAGRYDWLYGWTPGT